MGDLVLTCTGDLSRNRTVGLRLGRGESLEAIQASMSAVAEGAWAQLRCSAPQAAHALVCGAAGCSTQARPLGLCGRAALSDPPRPAAGVLTSRSAHHLALKLGVPCPIISGIYRVIHGGWASLAPAIAWHSRCAWLGAGENPDQARGRTQLRC
jgi:glycerol-3-phosphate dehydrogenase (NAD(P)+)